MRRVEAANPSLTVGAPNLVPELYSFTRGAPNLIPELSATFGKNFTTAVLIIAQARLAGTAGPLHGKPERAQHAAPLHYTRLNSDAARVISASTCWPS